MLLFWLPSPGLRRNTARSSGSMTAMRLAIGSRSVIVRRFASMW